MYLDGELLDTDEHAYSLHLSSCAPCNQTLREEQEWRLSFKKHIKQAQIAAPLSLRKKINEQAGHASFLDFLGIHYHLKRFAFATTSLCALFVCTNRESVSFAPMLNKAASVHKKSEQIMQDSTGNMGMHTLNQQTANSFVEQHLGKIKIPHIKKQQAQIHAAELLDLNSQNQAVMLHYGVGPDNTPVSLVVYPHARQIYKNSSLSAKFIDARYHRVFIEEVGGMKAAVWHDQDHVYSVIGNLNDLQMLHLLPDEE